MIQAIVVLVILVIFLFMLISASVKVVPEYQRAVLFRLGRLRGPKGPGLFLIIPIVDRIMRVDLRTVTLDAGTLAMIDDLRRVR